MQYFLNAEDVKMENTQKISFLGKLKAFLVRKDVIISPKRYGIDAMGAMALGLFGSLLIATIFNAIGLIPGLSLFATIGAYGAKAAGCAMAVAIAYALKAPPLVIYTCALVGLIANDMGGAGGPLAVLIIAIIAAEAGKIVSKETKVDILVTPFVTLFVGGTLSVLLAGHIGTLVGYIKDFIGWAMLQHPFVMGVIVSVVIGVALTLPISSAAICAALVLSGANGGGEGLALAGGAAVAGCCAQMVGFAVMSFRENRWGDLVSQGLGTSMLQMPNIVRNPKIWIAPIVTSAITGPIATCVFQLEMNGAAINSGMGTCGLCGQLGIWTGWLSPSEIAVANGAVAITPTGFDWMGLILISFVLPAILCPIINHFCRKAGWVKDGDLTLS